MRVTQAEEIVYELAEEELIRLLKVPADFRFMDAKMLEHQEGHSKKRVAGIRFRRKLKINEQPK